MICRQCFKDKNADSFAKNRRKCKQCINDYNSSWSRENKEQVKATFAKWLINNKEQHRISCQKWYLENKETYIAQQLLKRKTDLFTKLRFTLRARLLTALKREYKSGSAVQDLGCSIKELKKYLELQFEPSMSWGNWSRSGWHIDHIKPLAAFDLTDVEQLKQAVHFSNLQPLWAKDNLSKGDNYDDQQN